MDDLFSLTAGNRSSPVLVEVPHAGLAVPESLRDEVAAPEEAIWRDADIFVDRLYEKAPERGAKLLVAHASRYVVDLNRAEDDVDPLTVSSGPAPRARQPRGVIWRATTTGQSVLPRPLSAAQLRSRIANFHAPYHRLLGGCLEELRAVHGFAILIAAHSMPSIGRAAHRDMGSVRADVVPGTQGRTTANARLIDAIDAHFRAAGLSVRHDEPYRGGYTTQHYGRPAEGWHAVQIELNRSLYVDEALCRPKEGDFEELQQVLSSLIDVLVELDLR